MSPDHLDDGAGLARVRDVADAVRENVARAIVGGSDPVDLLLAALLAGGHVLIEDVPGTGKTTLAKAFAQSLGYDFRRVQFTPDLVPADLLGVNIYDPKDARFEFRPGPVFTHVLLADEINRATPRTQSALLEAMQEGQVSTEGVTAPLPSPFIVIATLNPVEMEGTFPLPEAQLDRFMLRASLGYPSREDEDAMLELHRNAGVADSIAAVATARDVESARAAVESVRVEPAVRGYLLDIVAATRDHAHIRLGVSPRGALTLQRAARARAAIEGRDYVIPDDVKSFAIPVLGHRLIVDTAAVLRGLDGDAVVGAILESVPVPIDP